jgi:hypothetical protein
MLSKLAKPLLVATSMAPILLAFAVNAISEGRSFGDYWFWLVLAALLVCLCHLIMRFSSTQLQRQHLTIKSFKSSDKEVMTFLVAYLLPLVSAKSLGLNGHLLSIVFAVLVFFAAIYHSNAFDFNPLLGLFGYHFYEMQTDNGMTFLLITRRHLLKPNHRVEVVQLFPYTFLNVGDQA